MVEGRLASGNGRRRVVGLGGDATGGGGGGGVNFLLADRNQTRTVGCKIGRAVHIPKGGRLCSNFELRNSIFDITIWRWWWCYFLRC